MERDLLILVLEVVPTSWICKVGVLQQLPELDGLFTPVRQSCQLLATTVALRCVSRRNSVRFMNEIQFYRHLSRHCCECYHRDLRLLGYIGCKREQQLGNRCCTVRDRHVRLFNRLILVIRC